MVLHIVQAEAPDDIVVGLGHVELGVAVLVVAVALAAARLAAAIAVGDQISLVVIGIDAGADPAGGRGRRAGRTGVRAAAAAGTQIAVDAAIAPVIALGVVLALRIHGEVGAGAVTAVRLALGIGAADGQNWEHRRRRQRPTFWTCRRTG